ncbi:hypothetical protein [Sporosarcina limicola]|uniref:Uncharacterized protein n=1 Tax=Sporosarcina limicola TaxID=34101 RepID=A0A927MMY9_9BACL|nr:hypothetical protein [Sporosarcina limicola]MBE1556087.1 hypothetical protein [Sporosarcina limicola]
MIEDKSFLPLFNHLQFISSLRMVIKKQFSELINWIALFLITNGS